MHGRLDGWPQTRWVQRRNGEALGLFGSRFNVANRLNQWLHIDGHKDVPLIGMGQPSAGCLDPQNAVLLYRRIATGTLSQQRVGANDS